MKKLLPILLLLVVCTGVPSDAQGQFWKKIFKRESQKDAERKAKEKAEKKAKEEKTEKKKKSPELPEFPETVKKPHYRIDVLIPVYLNSLVADNKPIHKSPPARLLGEINFYEGMKMAADTLNKLGMNLDIYIHDITDPVHSIHTLTRNTHFQTTDLVVGFLTSEHLPEIISFTKSRNINFISALSPADLSTRNDPYFILIQPTLTTHIKALVANAVRKFGKQPKFIFFKDDKSVQQEALNALTAALADNDQPESSYEQINCSQAIPSVDSLKKLFDPENVNVVFLNILSQSEAFPVLKSLSALAPEYRFAVFGMPSWKGMKQLSERKALPGLSIYLTNPFYYELSSTRGRDFCKKYGRVYGTSNPSEMVFRGYETLIWMANLLGRYGTVFNPKLSDSHQAPFTPYKVMPKWDDDNDFLYFENQHLYIYKYKDGVLSVD